MQEQKKGFFARAVYRYTHISLILRIFVGLVIGALLGIAVPKASAIGLFGTLFVNALKAIAPVLVFTLVISSLANGQSKIDRRFGFVIFEYLFSTLMAALVAVGFSFAFPITLKLSGETFSAESVPSDVAQVLEKILTDMLTNPKTAISSGNYISILFWAVIFGMLMKKLGSESSKNLFSDLSEILSTTVRGVIHLAPFGIMGLVFTSVSENGISIFSEYGMLILVLVASMATVALIVNPLIVFAALRKNPYPLVFRCIRESGLTAFFTRSSAANIPVNMRLCERLGLDPDIYSVSIPLGSTINMDGAAVVITIMTLAAVHTLGISVSLPSAVVLSLLSTLAACGASGVAGGSLLLIPMACSLFGIPTDTAMQVVGIGFAISVIQDSMETALNSSGDVLFTAVAEYRSWQKQGKSLPTFLGGETKVDI
ncbi:MAG: serine/threonine transporter SstT [Ruminococcus sp.]|nr:serine/threonine transporter SstT [Ruminococcus sp.]